MFNIKFKIPADLLTGNVSTSTLLVVMTLFSSQPAQANPHSYLAPPQNRSLAPAPVLAEQAPRPFGPLPSQSLNGTAVSRSTHRDIRQFPGARSYSTEAHLMQNPAKATRSPAVAEPTVGLRSRAATPPVFLPPSLGIYGPSTLATPPIAPQSAPATPLLVTNSDGGFTLRPASPAAMPDTRFSGSAARTTVQFSAPAATTVRLINPSPLATGPGQSPTIEPTASPALMGFANPVPTVRTLNPGGMSATAPGMSPLAAPLTQPSQKNTLLTQSSSNAEALTTPSPLLRSTALNGPKFTLQGVYLYQGDQTSARARLTIAYPLTPRVLFGTSLDLATGNAFTDTPTQGFSVNELYIATALADIPNLRFVLGQIDFTSYFDRNSFAKDGATHFFNAAFQTNPALSATGLSSRPGLLLNWALTDNIEAKAATFSSSKGLSDFSLDGFAGELGLRYGNAIIRGTYVTDRESGNNDAFGEVFQLARGNNQFGVLKGDREESYGVNAEVFIPNLKMGIFGRYGRYNNRDLGSGGDTYSGGITFLDLFAPDDRLGIGYGRGLSNDNLRRDSGARTPDVLEAFYDFRFLPNLRIGFSIQERNDFSEVIAGIRVKTEFDVTPKGRLAR